MRVVTFAEALAESRQGALSSGRGMTFGEVMASRQGPRTFNEIVAKRIGAALEQGGFVVVQKARVDDDKRLVFGWASVATKAGKPVVDHHGEVVDPVTMEAAAYDYVTRSRVGKRQHRGTPIMELVESVALTAEKQKAMGIDLGFEGWWTGFRVNDPATWAAAKAGEFGGLSVGGSAIRIPVQAG